AERRQDRRTLLAGHVEPAERARTLAPQHITAPPIRNRAGGHDLGRLAAAEVEHQPGRDLESILNKGRVEPTFEAIASIARNIELAAGRGGAHRVEKGGLDEDLCRRLGAPGSLAADDAAEALHGGAIGYCSHLGVERI